MTTDEVIQSELDEFKLKSKSECLSSFSHSLSFFLFSQWLKTNYEEKSEQRKVRDEVFRAWSNQISCSVAPIFSGINTQLSEPLTRWTNIVAGTCVSTESYQECFTDALKEIRAEFNKVTD